jgi:hypothetical protein
VLQRLTARKRRVAERLILGTSPRMTEGCGIR